MRQRRTQVTNRRIEQSVLIGEPSVGKTCVESLAERIVSGDVPSALRDKLVERYVCPGSERKDARSEFEDRLKRRGGGQV